MSTQSMPTYPRSPYAEPAPSTPVTWRCQIGAQSYTFVGIRILGNGWYVTGQVVPQPLSWDALCYLLPPEDGRFLVLGVVGQLTAPDGARP